MKSLPIFCFSWISYHHFLHGADDDVVVAANFSAVAHEIGNRVDVAVVV